MLDASSGSTLLSKSYEEGYKLIERITANTYQWPITRATTVVLKKKLADVYEVIETITLAAKVAQIHQIVKCIMTSFDAPTIEPVNIITDANEFPRV